MTNIEIIVAILAVTVFALSVGSAMTAKRLNSLERRVNAAEVQSASARAASEAAIEVAEIQQRRRRLDEEMKGKP